MVTIMFTQRKKAISNEHLVQKRTSIEDVMMDLFITQLLVHSVLASRFCGTDVQIPKVDYFRILFTQNESTKHHQTLGTNKTYV